MSEQQQQQQAPEPPQNNTQKDVSHWLQDQKNDQRARDVTGCWVWRDYSDLAKSGLPGIVSSFQAACQTTEFSDHWANAGFTSPSFHVNPTLKPGFPAHDKFLRGLQDLEHAACLGVVFHGTRKGNIQNILRDGLDPHKRSGQAYGPGEYFSKDPPVSVSYCHGGLEMLVFVVVLPSSLTQEKDKNTNQSSNSNIAYSNIPADYAVVNNNLHQIPIGTMRYKEVNHTVMHESQQRRSKFMQLSKEVFDKSQVSKEGLIKAEIIQFLIAGKVDVASEKYEKQRNFLKHVSKKEISWYVHQKLDEEIVFMYFTDLPKPMKAEEMEKAKIQSVDESIKQESEAKQRLQAEQMKSQLRLQQPPPPPPSPAQPAQRGFRNLLPFGAPSQQQQQQQQQQPALTTRVFSPFQPSAYWQQQQQGPQPALASGPPVVTFQPSAPPKRWASSSPPPFAFGSGMAASSMMMGPLKHASSTAAAYPNNPTAMDCDNDMDDGATFSSTDAVATTASAS